MRLECRANVLHPGLKSEDEDGAEAGQSRLVALQQDAGLVQQFEGEGEATQRNDSVMPPLRFAAESHCGQSAGNDGYPASSTQAAG